MFYIKFKVIQCNNVEFIINNLLQSIIKLCLDLQCKLNNTLIHPNSALFIYILKANIDCSF